MKFKTENSKVKTRVRFLTDLTTADLAFEAYGETPAELFENAGLAVEEVMVSPAKLRLEKSRLVKKRAKTLTDLLFFFLEELIFLKDAENLVFGQIKCRVFKTGKVWRLEADLKGEVIKKDEHQLGVDVKAVTRHKFCLKRLKFNSKGYKATVILDV